MARFSTTTAVLVLTLTMHIRCVSTIAADTDAQKVASTEISQVTTQSFQEQMHPLLTTFCVRCHNEEKSTSGIRVDHLTGALKEQHLFLWKDILKQVANESMPPEDEPQPTVDQRQRMVEWIERALIDVKRRISEKNGSVRRLTVAQYRNTLKTLLQIDDELTDILPPDAVSKDGFENNEKTMILSPLLLESYFTIAQQALQRCIVTEQSIPRIQNFRMDLGKSRNPDPYPDDLILGAFSQLLANQDFVVTELTPIKPFNFEPAPMQTQFEFIEGYQGNATVRGWRTFDSIYHAVFACMRGSNGYPKGNPWDVVPEGLLLRPAIPSSEIFGQSSTYGPQSNFKIALRELPSHGRFRVTVKASRYDDALLLDEGASVQPEHIEGSVTVEELDSEKTIHVDSPGVYQADVFLKKTTKEEVPPDASRLTENLIGTWEFDGHARSSETEKELVGTLQGGATYVESPFGQAISLDGTSGHVVVPRDESMNVGSGEFTVSAWIHPRELRQSGIVCLGKYGYAQGFVFDMPGSDGILRIETANEKGEHNGTVQSWAGVLRVNQWQHVAVVVRRGEKQHETVRQRLRGWHGNCRGGKP